MMRVFYAINHTNLIDFVSCFSLTLHVRLRFTAKHVAIYVFKPQPQTSIKKKPNVPRCIDDHTDEVCASVVPTK